MMARKSKRVIVGSDHAGLSLKRSLIAFLQSQGYELTDHGPDSAESVDYPDFAELVARDVVAQEESVGILLCGTGIGMSIAANKVAGARAALCHTEFEARATRAHNDANILCLGERVVGAGLAESIAAVFLSTEFEGGRHARRVEKIHALESTSGQ